MAGGEEGAPGVALGTKSLEVLDTAREKRSAETESIERVGFPTVPPMQEALAGSSSLGNVFNAPSLDNVILPLLSEPSAETQWLWSTRVGDESRDVYTREKYPNIYAKPKVT